MQWDDSETQDPWTQPVQDAAAPRLTGPITDPNDPRLADPSYASDPQVLAFLNARYGAGGTAQQPPPGTPGWDPNAQAWIAPAVHDDPGATGGGGSSTPPPTTGGVPAPGPTAPPTGSPNVTPGYTPPPAYVPPPAFKYRDFAAPTGDDVLNDPGYAFELNQGIQAIGAKNAALGTLNTGGTIKDFMGYGQNLASTKYNDLFNRKLTEYQTDRGNALDTYNTNYGTQYRDPYAINYQSQYADPFANNMQAAGLTQNNNQFNASLGQNNSQFNSNLDWQKFLQNYKATVTDPFQQKYSLLGLL